MPNSEEFERLRSPSELRSYVIHLRDEVTADDKERCLGIQKKGLYKEFLEELLPLSCFAVLAYPDTYKVRLVLGNQGYDAIVYDENEREIDRVEITAPHDGKAASEDAKLLVSRGFGAVKVGTHDDDFDIISEHVLEICRKKALIDYGDCTLVVSIAPIRPFSGLEDRYESRVVALVGEMASIKYRAKRVFLLILPDRLENVQAT